MSNEREILDPTPQCGDGDDGNGLDPVVVIVMGSRPHCILIPDSFSLFVLGPFDGGDRYRDFIRRLLFGA